MRRIKQKLLKIRVLILILMISPALTDAFSQMSVKGRFHNQNAHLKHKEKYSFTSDDQHHMHKSNHDHQKEQISPFQTHQTHFNDQNSHHFHNEHQNDLLLHQHSSQIKKTQLHSHHMHQMKLQQQYLHHQPEQDQRHQVHQQTHQHSNILQTHSDVSHSKKRTHQSKSHKSRRSQIIITRAKEQLRKKIKREQITKMEADLNHSGKFANRLNLWKTRETIKAPKTKSLRPKGTIDSSGNWIPYSKTVQQ